MDKAVGPQDVSVWNMMAVVSHKEILIGSLEAKRREIRLQHHVLQVVDP